MDALALVLVPVALVAGGIVCVINGHGTAGAWLIVGGVLMAPSKICTTREACDCDKKG